MSGTPCRIVLVDDHPLFRTGLAQLLAQEEGLEVAGEAATPEEALPLVRETQPQIVIVDLTLEGASGLDLIRTLRSLHPASAVLVVSMHDEMLYAERAMRAGARGYVMKREAAEEILTAVRTVLDGSKHLSAKMRDLLAASGEAEATSPTAVLSDREFEIFQLFGQGRTPRQIAGDLHLSVRTIEAHRENIKRKLGIGSAAELTRYALQWGEEERG